MQTIGSGRVVFAGRQGGEAVGGEVRSTLQPDLATGIRDRKAAAVRRAGHDAVVVGGLPYAVRVGTTLWSRERPSALESEGG